MKDEQPTEANYSEPVAYDAKGNPLYAHPPQNVAPQPAAVHVARSLEPVKQEVSEDMKKRHDRSVRQYPTLNLSEGEYIIRAVRRHPIGLVLPLLAGIFLIVIALTVASNFTIIAESLMLTNVLPDPAVVVLPLLAFSAAVALGMFIVYYVYVSNKFFLTNESVIQEIQVSLFSRHEQTVSLNNIEDASYQQNGIIQQIFNYGSIRLSTEGDETTYRFTYVANPKNHIATLNNAVEAFKNGRPVED